MSTRPAKDGKDKMITKVVVIGAGASGLMCSSQLLKKGIVSKENIVILEARGRVGGRIHTTVDTVRPVKEGPSPISLYRDHGAAWVHGTGSDWPHYLPPQQASTDNEDGGMPTSNPMMDLLQEATSEGENVCFTHLEPTFPLGNPWMRPGHVLLGSNNLVLYVDGEKIGKQETESKSILMEALELHREIMKDVGRIGYDLIVRGETNETVQQSLQQAIDRVLSEKQLDRTKLIPKAAGFYRHMIEAWHGTSASNIQLLECSACGPEDDNTSGDENWTDEGDFYGPHCTMRKGMHTVLEPLLKTTSSCIRLNQAVKRVTHNNDGHLIRVDTSTGMTVEADYCVVTVPLGCLAHSLSSETGATGEHAEALVESGTINFSPELSKEKKSSIERLCMGSYKKVYLTFDRIFWPSKETFVGLCRSESGDPTDGLGNYLLLDNLWACKGTPCIEAVLIGDAGKWATDKSDDTIRIAVLKFLADAMGLDYEGQLSSWCVDCHITRWEEDPYSRGAYSGYRLGTLEEHTAGLAASEWEGRLLFAGEATLCGYEGSVHAALISGMNVANQIEAEM